MQYRTPKGKLCTFIPITREAQTDRRQTNRPVSLPAQGALGSETLPQKTQWDGAGEMVGTEERVAYTALLEDLSLLPRSPLGGSSITPTGKLAIWSLQALELTCTPPPTSTPT